MSEDIECPHCGVYVSVDFKAFGPRWVAVHKRDDSDQRVSVEYGHCPSKVCQRLIVRTVVDDTPEPSTKYAIPPVTEIRIADTVDTGIVKQYRKAKRILPIDQNASAAMSRRCLEMLLRGFFKVKKGRLYDEIQELLDANQLPSYLAGDIDRIREIGNLGAHTAGDISLPSDASREEAEWSLEILEDLFEHIAGREKSRLRNEQFDRKHPKKGGRKATER